MKLDRWMQITLLAASIAAGQARQEDAEVLLRAAIEKESVDGDLKTAIQQYEKIARSGNRVAAAKALVRMGQCYEKLGDAEARKAYERAVREFGDQKDAASAARARLSVLAGPRDSGSGVKARLIWDKAARYVMNVSADGQWVPYLVTESSGLGVRNLATGEQRVLKNGKYHREGLDECLVSPDGKHVVFLWWQWEAKEGARVGFSIRVMRIDGTGERVLQDFGEGAVYPMPRAWSADGKLIAVQEDRRDGQRISILDVQSGKIRQVATLTHAYPQRIAFSPDGRWLAGSGYFWANPPRSLDVFTLDLTQTGAQPRVVAQNSQFAGLTPDGKAILHARVRGDINELCLLPVSAGKPAGESRLLNSVASFDGIPLGFTPGGTLYYEARNNTADALVSSFDPATAEIGTTVYKRAATALGPYGREGAIKFSRDGKKALVLLPRGALLIRSLADGSESTILPQMEAFWHLEWSADGQWLLANGNGWDGKNGLHRIDPRSGAASLIAESGQRFRPFGLFTPAPDGKTVYWPGNDRVITALNLETLDARAIGGRVGDMRELRVSPDGKMLAMFGENRVVTVNLLTGESKTLLEKRGLFLGGDWSPDNRFLYTTFGALDGPTEFHRIPMDGGEPLTRKLPDSYRNLRVSPDGKTIAATRWNQHRQVWTLENFLPAEFTRR